MRTCKWKSAARATLAPMKCRRDNGLRGAKIFSRFFRALTRVITRDFS
jgi:hypothetical protein